MDLLYYTLVLLSTVLWNSTQDKEKATGFPVALKLSDFIRLHFFADGYDKECYKGKENRLQEQQTGNAGHLESKEVQAPLAHSSNNGGATSHT